MPALPDHLQDFEDVQLCSGRIRWMFFLSSANELSAISAASSGVSSSNASAGDCVKADLLHGGIVGFSAGLDGDLRCHTTHGMDSSAVTGLDDQLAVCEHEWLSHGHHTPAVDRSCSEILCMHVDERDGGDSNF